MNPSGGRFWTMDSYEGTKYEPLSLHKYLYAGGDPVNKVDPSGLESSVGLLGALGGRNTISAMAVMRFIGIGIATVEAVCFTDIIGTSILREEGSMLAERRLVQRTTVPGLPCIAALTKAILAIPMLCSESRSRIAGGGSSGNYHQLLHSSTTQWQTRPSIRSLRPGH